MQTTTLGKTGLQVSRLGAGLAQIGALSLDEAEEAGKILGAALDGGIDFFDTAECYGNSEELIGKNSLSPQPHRESITIRHSSAKSPTPALR